MINKLQLYIPTRWSQLNSKQLLFMANLYVWNHGEADFLTKAFLFLSGLKITAKDLSPLQRGTSEAEGVNAHFYTHPTMPHPVAIDDELMAIMTDKCRYLLQIGEITPVKWIGLARARHPRLYNATFEEYLMAENYYFAYVKTREQQHLNNLAAVLYRRPWHRWDAEKIQQRALQFKNIPDDVRNSVFMWYVGFRGYIAQRCPTLFSAGGKSAGNIDVRNYINSLVHTLNGGDITRTDTLMRQPMWYALDEMEQRAREADELSRTNNK